MKLSLVGLSYSTAPLEVRERIAAETRDKQAALQKLLGAGGIDEACFVSTCNRVELYAAGPHDHEVLRRQMRRFLADAAALPAPELDPHLLQLDDNEAIRHLFRVSSSLDSMVVGEPQILGQVKEAFKLATDTRAARAELVRVFQRAFAVAKRVRNETGIAENAVSMSYAAVELGRQIFDELKGKQVLLVGAGKMGGLAAKHLRRHGVEQILVASRSISTAERVARDVGGSASSLDTLPLLMAEADIVICSTAAPGFVIDRKMVQGILRARRYRPLLMVDIAVPRDVDPRVRGLDNVFLYEVDDLQDVLASNREQRRREAEAAERIIEEELQKFIAWTNAQRVVPVIKALRSKAVAVAEAEVARVLNGTELEPRVEKKVRAMGNALVNKMLHPVLARLKEQGELGDPDGFAEVIMQAFSLEIESLEEQEEARPERTNVVPLAR